MITLILGPMMAGKSTEMIRLLKRGLISKKKCIFLRSYTDTRDFIARDIKVKDIEIKWINDDADVDYLLDYDVIGIDEIQFLSSKLLLKVIKLLRGKDKHLILSGLSATSEQKPFESVSAVIPYADNITKLNAICTKCGSELGSYTKYIGEEKKTGKILVGEEVYTAVCENCLDDKSISNN